MAESHGNYVTDRFLHLDSVEASLLELADAERAGVFRSTRIDARSLLYSTLAAGRAPRILRKTRWLAIAAVFVIAATVCGWLFTMGGALPARRPLQGGAILASATNRCDGRFFACLTGPNGTRTAACDAFDYDADGDIDLADARTYQLHCNAVTR